MDPIPESSFPISIKWADFVELMLRRMRLPVPITELEAALVRDKEQRPRGRAIFPFGKFQYARRKVHYKR